LRHDEQLIGRCRVVHRLGHRKLRDLSGIETSRFYYQHP
jgi:hypothetical protein